jgi:polar amino acid transport system substrate-binding protein
MPNMLNAVPRSRSCEFQSELQAQTQTQCKPRSRNSNSNSSGSTARSLLLSCMLASAALLTACSTMSASSPKAPAAVVAELAPSGTLRAAINYGNPILATKDPATGELAGISVDLARELAARLGVPVKFVPYGAARLVADGAKKKDWDVAFTGIDPNRAEDMIFTAPYVIIEGVYMVRKDSPFKTNADVDRKGVRIAVSGGSAYDLFLSRELKNATLVRAPEPGVVTDMMMQQSLEVVAGVKQRNQLDAIRIPELHLLDGNFMVIRQAMATLAGREAGARYIAGFIEEMKASGYVKASLARHHVEGAAVAPPAPPAPQ